METTLNATKSMMHSASQTKTHTGASAYDKFIAKLQNTFEKTAWHYIKP